MPGNPGTPEEKKPQGLLRDLLPPSVSVMSNYCSGESTPGGCHGNSTTLIRLFESIRQESHRDREESRRDREEVREQLGRIELLLEDVARKAGLNPPGEGPPGHPSPGHRAPPPQLPQATAVMAVPLPPPPLLNCGQPPPPPPPCPPPLSAASKGRSLAEQLQGAKLKKQAPPGAAAPSAKAEPAAGKTPPMMDFASELQSRIKTRSNNSCK